MKVQESTENYLETIYLLQKQLGEVRSIDVVNALGFSKPSISNAMKKLKAEGYVDMEDRGHIYLTEKGETLAKKTYERHCVVSSLLQHLGVQERIALEDACRIEHVISEETLSCMKKYLTEKEVRIHCS